MQTWRLHRALLYAHLRNFAPTVRNPSRIAFKHWLPAAKPRAFSTLSKSSTFNIQSSLGTWLSPPSRLLSTSSTTSEIKPTSAIEEASGSKLVLSPPALVITRDYEWGNIILGFEQANKYSIKAAPGGETVGYLAEESNFGGVVTRNLLRTRRPFKSTVFDKNGDIIFTLRRPIYLISTSIYIEDPDGKPLGEVQMDWHMWRRRYNLYVDKTQFASVDSGFLALDFDMRDVDGKKMASINKDFTGFAREIFTDSNQYVLRLDPSFGLKADQVLVQHEMTVNTPDEDYSHVKLGLRERAVILATAVAIDFDYFTARSRGGFMTPWLMPMPGGNAGETAPGGDGAGMAGPGAVAGADGLGGAAEGDQDYRFDPNAMSNAEDLDGGSQGMGGGSQGMSADPDPYETPFVSDDDNTSDTEWATFEEPDHGFQDEPSNNDDDDPFDGFGDGGDDGGGDGGGGLFGVLTDIFTNGGDS